MPFATLRFTPRVSFAPNRCDVRTVKPAVMPCANPSTNCSQCIRSDISANDNRVCHVVELLENISDNQRQRKPQNDRQRTALCHISFHEKTSSE